MVATEDHYECDRCGACCVPYAVNVGPHEIERNPAIAAHAKRLELEVITDNPGLYLSYGPDYPCGLLREDGCCSIYEDRPRSCQLYQPGSSRCQWARGFRGLMPLQAQPTSSVS